jgi:hypothetical protein
MDMHIHMGYCTSESFRILVKNYHSIDDHATYPEIDELIAVVAITPAEVAETLMRNEEPDAALQGLIELLKSKKECANKEEEDGDVNKEEEEEKEDDDDAKEENDDSKKKKDDEDSSDDDEND